jgi:hypothetical protein
VDYRAATGRKYDTPDLHYYTNTESIKQLRVVYSECSFTLYCECSDNILDSVTGDLNMSSVRKDVEACCVLLVDLWKKCFQDGF